MISIETNKDSGPSVSRLEWPPKKDDLRRLYIEERLSAAKIALAYGLKTPNPRSAATLVEYHLKKNEIERRNRSEELQGQTKSTVDEWSARYLHVESTTPSPAEETAVVELLRAPNLSIKHMEKPAKGRVDAVLRHLYHERGLSQGDIAKLIGNKTSGYVSDLFKQLGVQARDFEQARLKAVSEKLRKYERKSFDGTDEDKAYLLGLKHGDLSASRPWIGAIRVSTSTTHPALAKLFSDLFEPHGHVYQHPRYKKDTGTYEWNLQTILDSSFEFLQQDFEQAAPWIQQSEPRLIAYLSGLLDAEGSIITTRDQFGKVSLFLDYYNSNKRILEWVELHVKGWGYFCSIRINKKRGVRTRKYGIIHRSDYWQFSAYGMDRIQELIARLQPRHSEKMRRQRIALSVRKGQDFQSVQKEVELLRSQIKQEVQSFVLQAELEYKTKHDKHSPFFFC